jgi:glucose-6-phosphate isomerase
MSTLTHDISRALEVAEVRAAYERHRPAASRAVEAWRDGTDRNVQAFRRSLERTDDLDAAGKVVTHLSKDTSDIVLLGIGGSSLGAQAIAQLAFWGTPAYRPAAGKPRLHIIDNLDGVTFERFLAGMDLKTTRFHVVSKSGGTTEPLLQLLTAMDAIEKAGGGKYMKYHFAGEAEPGANPLRAILEAMGAPVLEHDPDLGGRYTAFSTVGLVPAMLAGLDAVALRNAGKSALTAALNPSAAPVDGAALSAAARDIGLSQQVLWTYSDRLERLAKWWRQLWAESLGKQGHGTTPVDALGPVDQHSQLQLYLDGPRDKLFTMVDIAETSTARANTDWARRHGLDLLAGRDMCAVAEAQARATMETLSRHGRPVRRLALGGGLNEAALAQLFIHFIVETLVTARLWNVDPFGQPAVEESKILTRTYLEAGQ